MNHVELLSDECETGQTPGSIISAIKDSGTMPVSESRITLFAIWGTTLLPPPQRVVCRVSDAIPSVIPDNCRRAAQPSSVMKLTRHYIIEQPRCHSGTPLFIGMDVIAMLQGNRNIVQAV